VDEWAVDDLVAQLAAAWNRGDAAGFAEPFRADGTFTNVFGATFVGKEEFEQRHRAIFAGPFKGSSTRMTVRRTSFLRPDVALVDVDCATSGGAAPPMESRLLLALSKDGERWTIAAFHNTGVQAPR